MKDSKSTGEKRSVSVLQAPIVEIERGTRFRATARRLSIATGGERIGCVHYEVPPGRTAFPYHYHCGIEEAIFVLDGEATLRLGDERLDVRPGDWIALPAGPATAHELVNTGSSVLRYLCVSTQAPADVVAYPDSHKVAAVGSPHLDFLQSPWVRGVYRVDATVDYYDGENDAAQ